MRIVPIAVSMPNWKLYTSTIYDSIGVSPTKKIDELNWNKEDPAVFLSTLNLDNKPDQAFTVNIEDQIYDHMFFTFFIEADVKVIRDLKNKSNLNIIFPKENDFSIVSGTLKQWLRIIVSGLQYSTDKKLRELLFNCMLVLESTQLKRFFANYKKNSKDFTIG